MGNSSALGLLGQPYGCSIPPDDCCEMFRRVLQMQMGIMIAAGEQDVGEQAASEE